VNVIFWAETTTRALVYSALLTVENLKKPTSRTLLVTLEWIVFGCVHPHPEESDCISAVRRPNKLVGERYFASSLWTPDSVPGFALIQRLH